MKVAVTVESTADLSLELLSRYDITVIPFTVLMGDKSAKDGEVKTKDIFEYFDKTGNLPKTSAVNEFEYFDFFSNLLQEYSAIIHISLSSKISSAYSHACSAATLLNNVHIIDSKSLSTGIALQAIYARTLLDKGIAIKEVVKRVENRRNAIQTSFVINTTKYLYKGGRCNGLARFGSLLLRIKPQIVMKNGKMEPGQKYFGKINGVVTDYIKDTLNEFNNPDKSIIFITHAEATQDVIDICKDELKKQGFKEIHITTAGATIASHCGPRCIGILYYNDGGSK